jgi:putative ABC transport system permease protein
MTRVSQMLLVLGLSATSFRSRAGSSLAIAVSMACITGVLLSTLSISNGMMRGFLAAAEPARAIVLPQNTLGDAGAGLPRNLIGTILDAPGIAIGANSRPLADAETILSLPPEQGMAKGYLRLRGIGATGFRVRRRQAPQP